MGNSFASNAECSFILDHERPDRNLAIIAGNLLKGKVVVRVKRTLPPTKLVLNLSGKEKTTVRHGHGKNRRNACGERVICSASFILRHDGSAEITPGTYVFPFEIRMPASLPSCMNGTESNVGSWTTQYRLTIDATYNRKTFPKVGTRYFTVASTPLLDERVPVLISPRSHDVTSLGGIKRGSIAIAARIVDVHVGRGTDLNIYIACRNDATASIYKVQVDLIEKMKWTARGHVATDSRTIAQLPDVDLPSILRGKQEKQQVQDQILSGGIHYDELQHLHEDLQRHSNMVTMKVPFACRDTYEGTLVRISHSLKITMFTRARISNPCIEVPLQIGYPPIAATLPPSGLRPVRATPSPNIRPPRLTPVRANPPPTAPSAHAVETMPAPHHSSLPMATAEALPFSIRNLPDTDIPIASAVIIPITDDAIEVPMASAPPEAMVLGGIATYSDAESSIPPDPPSTSTTSSSPSISALLEEMAFSINDYDIVWQRLEDPNWVSLFSLITPDELGSIVAHVNMDVDQPRIAVLMAITVGYRFTCQFAKAAVENSEEWIRVTTVQRLLPYCVDISTNHSMLREVLSDWQQAITQSDFDLAIRRESN